MMPARGSHFPPLRPRDKLPPVLGVFFLSFLWSLPPLRRRNLLYLLSAGHGFEHWYLGLIGPLLPFLAQDLNLTFTQIGFLFASRALCSALSSIGAGFFTDLRGGGKWILVGCLGGIALAHGGMSFAPGFIVLLILFSLSGVATHAWHPPAMRLIGDVFPDRKGFAFGLHGTGANIGQTLAPIAAGYLLVAMDWRSVLQINMIPLLLMTILLIVWLPPIGNSSSSTSSGASSGRGWFRQVNESLLHNPSLVAVSILSGVRTASHYGIVTFLPFLLIRTHGMDVWWVGITLGVYGAATILPETFIGHLSDRIPRRIIIFLGIGVGAISLALIPALAPGMALLLPLILIGTFLASLRSVLFAYAFDITPPHLRGSSVGLIFTTNQAFNALGPLCAGFLADAYGPPVVFWFFSGLALVSLFLFPFLPETDVPPEANAAMPRAQVAR